MAEPSYYDYAPEKSDSVRYDQEADQSWTWRLYGPKQRLKLEQGNFESRADAALAAHDAFGDVPKYQGGD